MGLFISYLWIKYGWVDLPSVSMPSGTRRSLWDIRSSRSLQLGSKSLLGVDWLRSKY